MICLMSPPHDCIAFPRSNVLSCADCPADLGFFWEWRSFGGGLSRFVGGLLDREDPLYLTLGRAIAMPGLLDLMTATGWWPEWWSL